VTLPPGLYEFIQRLCGLESTVARLSPHCVDLAGATVLDVGGGTGLFARILPRTTQYICLDFDESRLVQAKTVTPRVLRCDATMLAFGDRSVDCALCIAVAHHLPDDPFHRLLGEMARVVRRRLIFLEPLVAPSVASRLLRRFDDGSHFRTEDTLRLALSSYFSSVHTETFTIYHQYLLFIASPAQGRAHRLPLSASVSR
jgi:ubiquinone/menaquinone biosynthesis C-methylase UbiE